MNDLERDLREALKEKAEEARPAAAAPAPLLRRARRRQLRTILAGVITALAVVAGSLFGLRTLIRSPEPPAPRGGAPERTSTIQDFTITAPEGWTLVDLWPLAKAIAVSSESLAAQAAASPQAVQSPAPASPQAAQSPTPASPQAAQSPAPARSPTSETSPIPVPAGIPLFQLSNGDVGLAPVCGGEVPVDGAALYVALDADALQRTQLRLPPDWPVALPDQASVGPCGTGYYARFAVGPRPYFAFAEFGSNVSSQDRQQLIDAYDAMRVNPVPLIGPRADTPGYVIASGTAGGHPWNLEARPAKVNVELQFTQADDSGAAASGDADFTVPGRTQLEGTHGTIDGERIVFGAVAFEAEGIEYRAADGSVVDGTIMALPQTLDAPFNAFYVVVEGSQRGVVVAIAGDGQEIATVPPAEQGPVTSPEPSGGATPRGGGVIAQGSAFGGTWKLTLSTEPTGGYCLSFESLGQGSGMCSATAPTGQPDNPPGQRPVVDVSPAGKGLGAFIVGSVPVDVERVGLVGSDGRNDTAGLFSSPKGSADVRYFVLPVDGSGAGRIVFEDANGAQLYPPEHITWSPTGS